jgi:hypothetical protein
MAEKKRSPLRVKVFFGFKEDLEEKMQAWLDSTPEAEDLKLVIPASLGHVVVLIIFYKIA